MSHLSPSLNTFLAVESLAEHLFLVISQFTHNSNGWAPKQIIELLKDDDIWEAMKINVTEESSKKTNNKARRDESCEGRTRSADFSNTGDEGKQDVK